MSTEIVWFRRDARLHDNPAWAAGSRADSVVPLFVIDPRLFGRATELRRTYLIGGLRSLDQELSTRGGRLRVEHGDPREVIPKLATSLGVARVHVNREVSPFGVERDRAVARHVDLVVHEGTYVHPPGSVLTGAGGVFRVFTPFFKAWSNRPLPLGAQAAETDVADGVGSGLPAGADPGVGEQDALARLLQFGAQVDRYAFERDRPDIDGTSRLSVALKYGWLSPAEVVRQIGMGGDGRAAFVRQVAWRDFFGHQLSAEPESARISVRPEYRRIRWVSDAADLEAWKSGSTGYPFVDAGMRQLRAEGWMHNRVRMITASFLVKDLLVDWRLGERWFRHHLLDADVAQNVGNWQWVAGTGSDAAPYFRVFNPVRQSRRFDPEGTYIRRWVPEIAGLSARDIHAPWEMDPTMLAACGVDLGVTYPLPIIDHAAARARALETYARARDSEGTA
jgi:deoxyribodipyrimidine photo-lyase